MTFGEKIHRLRKLNGLSQEQLATKLNVSRQAISKWEMGAIPDIDNVIKISTFFDCSLDYLMNNDVDEMNFNNINKKGVPIQKHKIIFSTSWILKILAALSMFALLVMWMISMIVEFPITRQDITSGNFYTGFSGFVEHYHLTGFVYSCIVIWLVSISALAVWQLYIRPSKEGIKTGKSFLCYYLIRFVMIIAGTTFFIYGFLNPWKFYLTIQSGFFVGVYFAAIVALSIAINYYDIKE